VLPPEVVVDGVDHVLIRKNVWHDNKESLQAALFIRISQTGDEEINKLRFDEVLIFEIDIGARIKNRLLIRSTATKFSERLAVSRNRPRFYELVVSVDERRYRAHDRANLRGAPWQASFWSTIESDVWLDTGIESEI
jgi:hypothetical protein